MLYRNFPYTLMLANEQFGHYLNEATGFDYAHEYMEVGLGAASSLWHGYYFPLARAITFSSSKNLEEKLSSYFLKNDIRGFFLEIFAGVASASALSVASEGNVHMSYRALSTHAVPIFVSSFHKTVTKYLNAQDRKDSMAYGFSIAYGIDAVVEECYFGDWSNYDIYDSVSTGVVGMHVSAVLDIVVQVYPRVLQGKYEEWFGSEGGT